MLTLPWLGVPWRGDGERQPSAVSGLGMWVGCVSGDGDGWGGGSHRKEARNLRPVRWANPTDENRAAFALAPCSLPVLKHKILPGHSASLLGFSEMETFPRDAGWSGCAQAVASAKP